ncbi:glycoside hydrolase [Vibrio profundum]|uniref:glycoside hydrolase n=1 Tax=Vibrio profundum TaxID=2910247 RepID=UPI003D146A57
MCLVYKKLNMRFIATLFAILCSVPAWAVTLHREDGQVVSIDPQTLATEWGKLNINEAHLNVDGARQSVADLKQTNPQQASWTLLPAKIHVEASFKNALTLTFALDSSQKLQRNHPLTLDWYFLPRQSTKTLLLPFSEGMRVPTDNKMWAKFLAGSYSPSNTTQDLKMPFWTAQVDQTYFTYQLVTATNNQLRFNDQDPKLAMSASHQFTVLNQHQPLVIRITQGKTMLAGAKQYRQWRIAQHLAEPLSEKVQSNPNVSKLIGASMVYVFGGDGIAEADVKDWWGIKQWYLDNLAPKSATSDDRELKALVKGKDWFNHYDKRLLVSRINDTLRIKFPSQAPTLKNDSIESQYRAAQQRKQWLSVHAGVYLAPEASWGQALSKGMVENLQTAGLKRLWIGFASWMPAFYQPQVVTQAKKAGYLVGVYDSYNTAIPRGVNNDWVTAQLPKQMRQQCAIEQASGEKKTGFGGKGNYLDPSCMQDYVKKRIEHVVEYGHFNSYFLDADATAMAREDYRDNTTQKQMLTAFNQRLSWTANQQHLVLGSEDGNSLTTQGIAFAHGLEAVGFGWTDQDMKSNRKSPYYLGRWYPDNKPDRFFKPAKVKEPYKTLLFAPQYRVPLYQTVFHDEVINSDHWLSDNLKFSDVKKERDLIAMLYNTPAMVHLSRDEALSPTSPRLKQLKHYQDGYMPIHKVLWNKQLVSFHWLNPQGTLQQTKFSDGSTIAANFTSKTAHIGKSSLAPMSILAKLSTGQILHWQPMGE